MLKKSFGFLGSIRAATMAEVLADFIKLSRQVLEADPGDNGKNVAAVLAAAAFEDSIRRIAEKHEIPDTEKLADLLTELKTRKVLDGAQVGIAQSYLKFRNSALHAKWSEIERSSVSSVLGF